MIDTKEGVGKEEEGGEGAPHYICLRATDILAMPLEPIYFVFNINVSDSIR